MSPTFLKWDKQCGLSNDTRIGSDWTPAFIVPKEGQKGLLSLESYCVLGPQWNPWANISGGVPLIIPPFLPAVLTHCQRNGPILRAPTGKWLLEIWPPPLQILPQAPFPFADSDFCCLCGVKNLSCSWVAWQSGPRHWIKNLSHS